MAPLLSRRSRGRSATTALAVRRVAVLPAGKQHRRGGDALDDEGASTSTGGSAPPAALGKHRQEQRSLFEVEVGQQRSRRPAPPTRVRQRPTGRFALATVEEDGALGNDATVSQPPRGIKLERSESMKPRQLQSLIKKNLDPEERKQFDQNQQQARRHRERNDPRVLGSLEDTGGSSSQSSSRRTASAAALATGEGAQRRRQSSSSSPSSVFHLVFGCCITSSASKDPRRLHPSTGGPTTDSSAHVPRSMNITYAG